MRLSLLLTVLMALHTVVNGQHDISRFFSLGSGAIKDIETLTGAYLSPLGKGLSTTLSSGWNNTAEVHRKFGFDLSIGFTLTTVPEIDRKFNLNDYKWEILFYDRSAYLKPLSPTIAGKQDILIPIGVRLSDNLKIENMISMPQGMSLNTLGLPIVQLGVGLIGGTDVQMRFMPPLNFSDYGRINILGFGVKHNFKQWIPVVNKLPFDASFIVNYAFVNTVFSRIEFFPTKFIEIDNQYIDTPLLPLIESASRIKAEYYNKQELLFNMNSLTTGLMVSKKFLFATVFGSIGYNWGGSQIKLAGPYLLPSIEKVGSSLVVALREENRVENPINTSNKYKQFRAGAGFRLMFAMLTLHGEVTFQNYMMYNFGVGLSIR